MNAPGPIAHVSDTARWVATYRAMESDRPDAIFRDPYARRLAGPEGERIVNWLRRGRQMAWAMIVRTAVMDEIVLRIVRAEGVNTVLNLAAGLDTRPWRLDLPPALDWIEVDLPGMIEFKRTQMTGETPRCRVEMRAADLQNAEEREAVLDRATAGAGARALVITEGLLIYLTREAAAALAGALSRRGALAWWLTDLAGPLVLKMQQRQWGRQLAPSQARFRFGPAEGTAFFEPFGWTEAEYRSLWEEGFRLKRTMRHAWLWRLVGALMPPRQREKSRRMSGVVLLGRR